MKIQRCHIDDRLYWRLKNGNHSINEILALGFQKIDEARATLATIEKDSELDRDADLM